MKMTKGVMLDMGYRQDGNLWNKLWISPTSGECMSYEQARQEAEQQYAKSVAIIADCADGGPVNGHGE
jgi:hypothetical protein